MPWKSVGIEVALSGNHEDQQDFAFTAKTWPVAEASKSETCLWDLV
jgi:hypothetical protein